MPPSINYLKSLTGVIVLYFLYRIQSFVKPYHMKIINELESKEIITSMITLYGASIFLQDG